VLLDRADDSAGGSAGFPSELPEPGSLGLHHTSCTLLHFPGTSQDFIGVLLGQVCGLTGDIVRDESRKPDVPELRTVPDTAAPALVKVSECSDECLVRPAHIGVVVPDDPATRAEILRIVPEGSG
jgi:hypothetical protein